MAHQRIRLFTCSDICSDKLIENNDSVIVYLCNYWTTCEKKLFQRKYRRFIRKMRLVNIANNNLYISEKYLVNRIFTLSTNGKNMKKDEMNAIGNTYSGMHIRTFGFFKDFSERREDVPKKFNIDGYINRILEFYKVIKIKTVYLCSDSIKMKNIINGILNKRIKLIFKNETSKHNRNSMREIDRLTFIDLELLSEAKMALLTKSSTFSLLVFMKNRNCKSTTCFFYRGH